ncbi:MULTISPECIES: hypothetical protein [Pseudomonas]|uniref:Site-specific integrase n=2 Tax=Pseudomonas TaxID=286 RepID=A0A7V8J1L5_PSEPU|nr:MULTISPECIES: hypothetical protein [Pseudomonas]KAF0251853.1 hypothetical protein GN299_26505 [Pseudomonas putida]UUC21386.1 hypothetical protein NOV18_13250 [Pseudomonas asiatica]HDS0927170.1 hypothetical protein [Pseudomonas putida]
MNDLPFPCFLGIEEIQNLNAQDLEFESAHVKSRLKDCPSESRPLESYALVKSFLQAHAVATRYNIYRSAVERLLLWCLLVVKKPIALLNEYDIRSFMDFCLYPPDDWVAPRPEKRLMRASPKRSSKLLIVNPEWRPFRLSVKEGQMLADTSKISTNSSLAVLMSVVNQFYLFLAAEDVVVSNPAWDMHDSKQYTLASPHHEGKKSFSEAEWRIFVLTAESMADSDPDFERKLFLIMTIYYLSLRPKDIEDFGWLILMESLTEKADGTYGLNVPLIPELKKKIIPSEYVERHVARFRSYLGTYMIPLCSDTTPIISTRSGRGGISGRHANVIFKSVCNKVVTNLELSGVMVPNNSAFRNASLLWLRETSLTRLAEAMPFDDFYQMMRDATMDNVYARFYAWQPKYRSE